MSPLRSSATGILLAGLLFALPVPILKHAPKAEYFLYAGSKSRQGIYLYKFNAVTPSLTAAGNEGGLAATLSGVTALAPHPGNRFLYAATSPGVTSASSIAGFAIHPETGALRLLNSAESARKEACSVSVEKKGWMLLVSYCGSGSIESFRVAGDGGVGESTGVQQHEGAGAHPHGVDISPDNFFLFSADLDKVFQYRFDPARAIFWPNDPAAAAMKTGAHATSMAFRPDEKFVYVADETGSTLSTFNYDREKGTLKLLDSVSTLPGSAGAIEIDSAGRFLYVGNLIDNSISVLAIDRKKGTLTKAGRVPAEGKTPVALRIDPTGRFLFVANQGSGRIVVFQINPKNGLLTPAALSIDLPDPTCFQFVPVPGDSIH